MFPEDGNSVHFSGIFISAIFLKAKEYVLDDIEMNYLHIDRSLFSEHLDFLPESIIATLLFSQLVNVDILSILAAARLLFSTSLLLHVT